MLILKKFTKKYGMKHLVFAILITVIQLNGLGQDQQLTQWVNDFSSAQSLNHGSVSIAIRDKDGVIIAGKNQETSLPTASTAKLFSTASALEILGPDYKAKTRLYIEGDITKEGELNGNIWIRGGGDPSLGSKYFHDDEDRLTFLAQWAEKIKAHGIKKINGAVIADASEFGYVSAPDSWTWNDMGNYYGASPSGLTVMDNTLEYHFKTSNYQGGKTEITEIQPPIDGLKIINEVTSENIKYDNSYIYGAPFSLDRIATGSLPMGRSDFVVKGSLPDPELAIAQMLAEELLSKGVTTSELAKAKRQFHDLKIDYSQMKLIHTETGASIQEIITLTNFKSINLFAEHLLCLIAYENGQIGSVNNGVKFSMNYWKGRINTDGLNLTDGSGLSRSNGISASHLTALLHYMNTTSKYKDLFYKSLPVSGESGTLKSLCKGQKGEGKIHAKSGTMNRIKSYAGYIESGSGKHYTFAIITNNFEGSVSGIKREMEVLLNSISGL